MGINFTKKFISFLLIIAFVTSCGTKPEDEVKSNLISAEILLSTSECQEAIDLLESMGRQNKNARYLKLLASAYACRAGYSTIKFFADDIALTATPAPMGGLSRYSTSQITFTSPLEDDLKFKDLQTAIDILLYAGGIATTTEPTSVVRATNFSSRDASDINAQMAYMMLVQMGRMFKVYANANAAGVKGAGLGSNVCFTDYPNISLPVKLFLQNDQQGACKVVNSSHAQLDSTVVSEANRRARLCQGIVLLNGILDVLPAIIVAAGGGDLGDIEGVTDDIQAAKEALEDMPGGGGVFAKVMNVLSQNNCETDTSITLESIESYYAVIIEGLIE